MRHLVHFNLFVAEASVSLVTTESVTNTTGSAKGSSVATTEKKKVPSEMDTTDSSEHITINLFKTMSHSFLWVSTSLNIYHH